jgi:hypothetical protein
MSGVSEPLTGQIKVSAAEAKEHEDLISAKRITEIPTNLQMMAAYSSTDGLPDYVGYAAKGLAAGTNGWLLQKFTYDASRQCTVRQIAYGNWTNRTGASYS